MATIYIDNLIKPRQVNSPTVTPSTPVAPNQYVYCDLHLDLSIADNRGNGLNAQSSNDINVDYDYNAIRNSLTNIFNTLPGQKILNPSFGANLEQFLFDRVDNIKGKILGNTILQNINNYEPRVTIQSIQVQPLPDQQLYYVLLVYQILNIGVVDKLQLQFNATGVTSI
jgi:phage baseplate assembly protein W